MTCSGTAGDPFPEPMSTKTPVGVNSRPIHSGSRIKRLTKRVPTRLVRLSLLFQRLNSSQYTASLDFSAADTSIRNLCSSDSRIVMYDTKLPYRLCEIDDASLNARGE